MLCLPAFEYHLKFLGKNPIKSYRFGSNAQSVALEVHLFFEMETMLNHT